MTSGGTHQVAQSRAISVIPPTKPRIECRNSNSLSIQGSSTAAGIPGVNADLDADDNDFRHC